MEIQVFEPLTLRGMNGNPPPIQVGSVTFTMETSLSEDDPDFVLLAAENTTDATSDIFNRVTQTINSTTNGEHKTSEEHLEKKKTERIIMEIAIILGAVFILSLILRRVCRKALKGDKAVKDDEEGGEKDDLYTKFTDTEELWMA